MSGYIGPIPVPQGIQNKETFTATAGQTTFNTNGYTDGAFISVYLNGVRLVNGTDYTATNGSDFVLTQAASVSDVVDFESFNSFSLASQQFENITTKNPTHEDTDGGRESALSFQGEQSGGEISTLAAIQASHDGTADDQKGDLIFKTNDGSDNNAPTEAMRINSDQNISIPDNGKVMFGTGNDLQIYHDATNSHISNATGNLTFDVAGDITLDADGADIILKDDGTQFGQLYKNGNDFRIESNVSDGNLVFTGNDGGSGIVALTLDMSDAGTAIFNNKVNIGTASGTQPSYFHSFLNVQNNASASDHASITITSGTGGFAGLHFGDSANGRIGQVAYNNTDNSLIFTANNSERVRIRNDGYFRIGDANDQAETYTGANVIMTSLATNFGNHGIDIAQGSYTGAYNVAYFRNGNGEVGKIQTSGTGTTFFTSSDYRLKENVEPISNGITRLKQLKPSRFNFITDADKTLDGFLAHEAQAVVPESASGTKDAVQVWKEHEKDRLPDGVSVGDNKLDDDGNTIPEIQGIDPSRLVPLLTAALQEAIAKIETLETKVAALEAE